MNQQAAIYAGSFDPITYGHVDLIQRMSHFYSPLIVLIARSPWKDPYFSLEERKLLLQECLQSFSSVQVDQCSKGLVVDYAKQKKIRIFIRGARTLSDFEYELNMSHANRTLYPELETFIVLTSSQYNHFSSKMVREIAINGGDVSYFVPKNIYKAILKKQKRNQSQ